MVVIRSSKSFSFIFNLSFPFRFQVNFIRQLVLLCVHLFFLSTAIFLRHPKGNQPLIKTIFCHIAEVCVLGGCIISIFALLAKEIYLQGYSSYFQNLVRSIPLKIVCKFSYFRKVIRKNCCINVHVCWFFSLYHFEFFI